MRLREKKNNIFLTLVLLRFRSFIVYLTEKLHLSFGVGSNYFVCLEFYWKIESIDESLKFGRYRIYGWNL